MANDKMAKFTFEIDVYSDTICPWCYISKKALDKAIATYTAEHPGVDFKLTWKPYMLWPNARVSGMSAPSITYLTGDDLCGPQAQIATPSRTPGWLFSA